MKRNKKSSEVDYTLLQDIIDTYRYPDGTLNRIAVFISTLALVLLLVLGHFLVQGFKNIRNMETVSASELTVDEIQDYITKSYLDAINDYSGGQLDQEAAKKKILKLLAEYLNSENGFTTEQTEALSSIINEYLTNTEIFNDINDNKESIEILTKLINTKTTESKNYTDQLVKVLQDELNNNSNLDQERLNTLLAKLEALKAASDAQINDSKNELKNTINQQNQDIQTQLTQKTDDLQKQIDIINGRISDNQEFFQFGIDPVSGAYGYKVNGQFKPW